MKITVIGGGPAGMYYSILVKKAMPDTQIDIYEQNKISDTFGFGVVFSDETLNEYLGRDQESYKMIRDEFAYWDNLDIVRNNGKKTESVRITGNGFCGFSRMTLLRILNKRCQQLGINIHEGVRIEPTALGQFKDSDIIVASDGIGSAIRTHFAKDFKTNIDVRNNHFVWLGSEKPLDAFTYFFKKTPYGTMVAHTYQYEKGRSTWVIEVTPEAYKNGKFELQNEQDTKEKMDKIWAEELDGYKFLLNKSHWRQFPAVTNEKWNKDNIILLGDAVLSAHYSIGSGTKLAMDEAIGLADATIKHKTDVQKVFADYVKNYRPVAEGIRHAANDVSLKWFESMDRFMDQDFPLFAFNVMSRSKKITYENLRRRDHTFSDKTLDFYLDKQKQKEAISPAFTSFKLKGLKLENRMVMSSMGQYSAQEGLVNDWHFVHYSSRAIGGVGLINTEMTAISPEGRISTGCAGIWDNKQAAAWGEIVDFVHQNSHTKISLQLGHAGPKAGSNYGATVKLSKANWKPVAASANTYGDFATPQALSMEDMQQIKKQFVSAAKKADKVGFDMLELHCAHGFLLASFLSPLTNKRNDRYGGSLENRLRFPIEVLKAVRAKWDSNKPLSVRISATDWAEGGNSVEDGVAIAKALKAAGADIVNVSSGGTVANEKPIFGRMWQVPISDAVRNDAKVPTMVAGAITNVDQINTVLLAERADLVVLGRPLLINPAFVREAQAYEQYKVNDIESFELRQYARGMEQLYTLKRFERDEFEHMKMLLKPKGHQ